MSAFFVVEAEKGNFKRPRDEDETKGGVERVSR